MWELLAGLSGTTSDMQLGSAALHCFFTLLVLLGSLFPAKVGLREEDSPVERLSSPASKI